MEVFFWVVFQTSGSLHDRNSTTIVEKEKDIPREYQKWIEERRREVAKEYNTQACMTNGGIIK